MQSSSKKVSQENNKKKKSKNANEPIVMITQNVIHGLYISRNGESKVKKNKTIANFIDLLGGSMTEYPIGDGYSILYNRKSNAGCNKFLLRFVHDTSIEGPIIFVNYEKKDIIIDEVEKTLKKVKNQHLYDYT